MTTSRPIPSDPADRERALMICDWAHDSAEAFALDPFAVSMLRNCVNRPGWVWREVLDRALRIWEKGYQAHLQKETSKNGES